MQDVIDPGTYLEIGIRNGNSLSLARCPTVGIDPDFTLTAELAAPVWLFRTTSDEYFTRAAPLAPFEGKPIDFAFIDGMHLFEYALRDFINVEKHSAPWTVVVFDDMFPANVDQAARHRHTKAWTGDVYKIIQLFRERRPDLQLTFVKTTPTGLLIISNLDSSSRVLEEQYDEIVATMVHDDPQVVPEEILKRQGALAPAEALSLDTWTKLRAARPGGGEDARRREAIAPRRALRGPVDIVAVEGFVSSAWKDAPTFARRAKRALARRVHSLRGGSA
jgi:hypothetical protein